MAVVGSLRGSRAGSQLLRALVFLSVEQEKLFPPWDSPGDWSCWLQSSVKHGTMGFVSHSWLRFGARAARQAPSLFLSSPFVACNAEAKSSAASASGFTKAAEHPTTPLVTPVGMSHLQAAAICAIPPARPSTLWHGVVRMEVATRVDSIMVLCCSKEIAVPRQGQHGRLSASCFWSQEQRGSQDRGVQGSLPDMVPELLDFAEVVEWAWEGNGGLGVILGAAGSTCLLKVSLGCEGPCSLLPRPSA